MKPARPQLATRITVCMLSMFAFAANASTYTVEYTGTVDFTYLYGSNPLPNGVTAGSVVDGSFTFNTGDASTPSYSYISCGGICYGDGVSATFNYPANLPENITINGNVWTGAAGAVWLMQDFTSAIPQYSLGVYSNPGDSYGDPLLSLTMSGPNSQLFNDINNLGAGIQFGTPTTITCVIRNNDYYISFSVDQPLQFSVTSVPEPATALLLGFGILGMCDRRKRAI